MENISPEYALRRATLMIKFPLIIVIMMPLPITMLLKTYGLIHSDEAMALITGIIQILSISCAWLIWSTQVPRWRLWAYQRVTDIAALEKLAIKKKLIWAAGSPFERTEIMKPYVRAEIDRLRREKIGGKC